MRLFERLTLGLALATALAAAPAPVRADAGKAYQQLGELPLMHHGRVKPLDTVAREEVKHVFGRESIKLTDPLDPDKTLATWGPVAALIDWQARPDFWDEQPIILCEYLPLKQMILGPEARTLLRRIADRKETPAATRDALKARLAAAEISSADLASALRLEGVTPEDAKALRTLANRMEPSSKWLRPDDLTTAEVTVGGKAMAFTDWFGQVIRSEGGPMSGKPKLSTLEEKVKEVGGRWIAYQEIRDRNQRGLEAFQLLALPRPSSDAYLKFTAEAVEKVRNAKVHGLDPVEEDALHALETYFKDLQNKDKALPGKDPEFDRRYKAWLAHKSAWVPLRLLVDAEPAELERAGFPVDKVAAFREAYQKLLAAEREQPAEAPAPAASAVVAAARSLGDAVGPYPSVAEMARESFYNRFAPFYKAPMAYGLAFVLLLIGLGIHAAPGSRLAKLDRVITGLGLAALVAGVVLELVGFYLRVRISGWAPVTNMYETVIWVALVAAVLGLIQAGFRKKFPAVAASGVALLCTVLCAGVPSLLDPNIKPLTPVLRSNYWLAIHVLTEVSSYGAFALAMALGLIATVIYLTATYRRPVGFHELFWPFVPGVPLAALGYLGYRASLATTPLFYLPTQPLFVGSVIVAMAGGALILSPISAVIGELISRLTFRDQPALDEAALAGESAAEREPALAAGGAAVATIARPTVAEIRARQAASRPKLDARAQSMQATAAIVKPLANFIYRAMQVGVLLITAGTILGGIWADYSWGRFWGWDPKEVWALITLLVYLVPLHGRFAGLINTFGLVCASVVCFLSVVMAWYGVNFVLGVGLHSYGFVEGGSQGSVAVVLTAVLSVVVGAFWRRHRSYIAPVAAA